MARVRVGPSDPVSHGQFAVAADERFHRAVGGAGDDIPDESIAHLSPLAWNDVNLLGQYPFDASRARSLEHRRPLRSGVADDGEDDGFTG